MTSRNVIQQQNRGDAVPEVRKLKNVGAERKSRRALGDIGNLVTSDGVADGKKIPQISRRVTRGFGAQLLANAQAAAAADKKAIPGGALANKKAIPGALAKKKVDAKKPVQKKDVLKQKPVEIIEISPDSREVAVEKETLLITEKSAKKSVKKNARTFSSSLTARSKAACGMNKKDKIVDIDAADADNELAAVEYVEDLYKYYKSAEGEGRVHDYMASQPEINVKMRAILVDWLVQVHCKFELSQETLYLTITLVDRYLAAAATSRGELQLLGLGALLIASKYEEIWALEVDVLVSISDRTYTNQQVLVMEKRILGELEWQLTIPTAYVFLVRFIKASMTEDTVEHMVYYFAELGMMNYETIIHHCPSMIAASAVYAARRTLSKTPFWTATLKAYTGFSKEQLIDCAKQLVIFHSNVVGDQKLTGSYRKYSKEQRGAVSLLLPAKSLL